MLTQPNLRGLLLKEQFTQKWIFAHDFLSPTTYWWKTEALDLEKNNHMSTGFPHSCFQLCQLTRLSTDYTPVLSNTCALSPFTWETSPELHVTSITFIFLKKHWVEWEACRVIVAGHVINVLLELINFLLKNDWFTFSLFLSFFHQCEKNNNK